MNIVRVLLLVILAQGSLPAWASEPEFPGLKSIMSETDWQRAKLDRLDEADLRVINEAFSRYLKMGAPRRHEPAAATAAPTSPPADAASVSAASTETAAVAATPAAEKKPSLWARFGLHIPVADKQPVQREIMWAKAVAWKGANGFVLDNGQVWEGIDPIRDEIVGREIGIMEGRFGSFLLVVDDDVKRVRLHRVK